MLILLSDRLSVGLFCVLLILLHFVLGWHVLHTEEHEDSDTDDDARWRLDESLDVERLADLKVVLRACRSHRAQISQWESLSACDVVSEICDALIFHFHHVKSIVCLVRIDGDEVFAVVEIRSKSTPLTCARLPSGDPRRSTTGRS